jgi:putative ABC transport system permease protein
MLKINLKIALRQLSKNRLFTFLNISGLAIGLAAVALIGLHVVDELSFDRFHSKKDRLFRVVGDQKEGFRGEPASKNIHHPMPLGPALKDEIGDVEMVTRMRTWGGFVQSPMGLFEEPFAFADADFFKMFSFEAKSGNPFSALDEPNELVLTEKSAKKYFGYLDAVGQTITLKVFDSFEPFRVSAVVADPPTNSTLRFGILLPFAKYAASERGKGEKDRWSRWSHETFVLLREGSTLPNRTEDFANFHARHFPEDEKNARQKGWWKADGVPFGYELQPIKAMRGDVLASNEAVDRAQVFGLLGIGGLVLLIACANFTTLSIGRSAGRALDIGVRKTLGGTRFQLAGQLLFESVLLSFAALAVGFLIAKTTLPMFNKLLGKDLLFDFRQFPELAVLLPLLALAAGLLAGAYPAGVLTSFRPMEIFRKKARLAGSNFFTKTLVTAQFALSVALGICMLTMLAQMDFLSKKPLGFEKENVVIVEAFGVENAEKTAFLFENELKSIPEAVKMSHAEMSLGGEQGQSVSGFEYRGKPMELFDFGVDTAYLPTLGLQLLAGRNFSGSVVADTQTAIILNESAVVALGWTLENAVGQRLTGFDGDDPSRDPEVVGVVKNYHFGSLREEVKPMMLQQFDATRRFMFFVRLKKGAPTDALASLQKAWTKAEPRLPFRYHFLDASLDTFYKKEQRWSKIVSLAGGLSLFLACLGLFGLAALTAVNRTKEIGIRKVLGASVAGLTALLARDFLKSVVVAIVVASPVAYFLMKKWLADFAFRIEIGWENFALAGFAAVGIAFLTVSFQAIKAALADPVKSLRSE